MTSDNIKRQLIQNELDKRENEAQKAEKLALLCVAGIGAIAMLGLISSLSKEGNDSSNFLKVAPSILLASWAYIKHLNIKLNAQNFILYKSLNQNKETALSEIEKINTIENITKSSIIAMGGIIFSTTSLIFATGIGAINSETAIGAEAGILIATELFLNDVFKKENRFLKSHLPNNIIIPLEGKNHQRGS